MDDVVAPVFQVYDAAPVAIKFTELPAQMVAAFTATVGAGATVTVEVFTFVQPPVLVPVIVYTVVVAGVTTILLVVAPVFQL